MAILPHPAFAWCKRSAVTCEFIVVGIVVLNVSVGVIIVGWLLLDGLRIRECDVYIESGW